MRVKDFEEFQSPSRKPWLLLAVLVAAGVWYLRGGGEEEPEPRGAAVGVEPAAAAGGDEPSLSSVPVGPVAGRDEARPVPIPSASVRAKLAEAKDLEKSAAFPEARLEYLALLEGATDSALRLEVEAALGRIHIALVTTAAPWPGVKDSYVVQAGNSVERIARKFGTTIDLICIGNNIRNANRIRQGDLLRVFTGKFKLVANKKRKDLVVYMNDEFFKRYRVGTGRYDKTPAGTFVVTEKIKEPVWWRPDGSEVPFGSEENILGTRWMTIRATGDTPPVRGYGIHGTWADESIGKAESAGCLRMHNADVEELYNILPIGTELAIEE